MRALRTFRARIRGLLHRNAIADEIREELEFHLRMRAEEYERRGDAAPEAERRARQRVGNLAVLVERGYDVRGGGLMETILQDIRYGLRLLGRQRGFSILAIVTLALGIGLSTALVSVIDAAILHPLPYPDPEQMVKVFVESPQRDGRILKLGPSLARAREMAASGHVFSVVAVWRNIFTPIVTNDEQPERLRGLEITEGYLPLFGVKPLVGRGIEADDTRTGAAPVVLLGFDYWQRRYAGNRDVIGQTIRFDVGAATVVGVLPSSFSRATAIWRPLEVTPFLLRLDGAGTATYARLLPGITRDRAERELTDLVAHVAGTAASPHVALERLLDSERRGKPLITTMAGAVMMILLIVCVNVGGLLLARGSTRLSEVAVRAAIGADRLRLIRQLMTESLVLGVLGGLAGIVLAWWSLDALVASLPMSLPSNSPATINTRVLFFCLGLSLVTAILFGLVPALKLSRVRVEGGLAPGARSSRSQLSRRGGQVLIGVEVALAVVLLAGAGLMLSSFARLLAADLGFDPDSFVTIEAQTVDSSPATITQYYPRLVEAVRALPEVVAAGAINDLPLKHSATHMFARLPNGESADTIVRQVLPGYFEALGLQLKAGRFPTDADRTSGRNVLVLSEEAARHNFPAGMAIGQRIQLGTLDMEVIGVTSDVRANGALSPLTNEVYMLMSNGTELRTPRGMIVVVRPKGHVNGLFERLRQIASSLGPRVIIDRVAAGRVWLDAEVLTARRRTTLLTLLGGLGLLLALVGIFGMTAYAVARRTQEIGVRMAFGASPRDVVSHMVADATLPVCAGILIGLGASAIATRIIASFLFDTTPTDPGTFAVVALTIGLTSVLAAWIPARRAARVDPVKALRAE